MRQEGVVFSTRLSTKECADVFRQAASAARGFGARVGEFGAKVRGRDQSGFFTPDFDSPFSGVDGAPDFAVGVHIGKFVNGASGAGTTIHMYIDEAQNGRSVQIVSPHGLTGGGRSGRFVLKFLEAFQAADPNLSLTDGNVG
jgi:hypothetical protein